MFVLRRLVPVLLAVVLPGAAIPQPPTDTVAARQAQEIKRLSGEANALLQENKLPEAIAVLKKKLALERSLHGGDSSAVTDTLDLLGEVYTM